MYNTKDCKDKKESCLAFIGFVPDFTSYGTIASVLLPPTVASNRRVSKLQFPQSAFILKVVSK